MALSILQICLTVCTIAALLYWILCLLAAHRFFSVPRTERPNQMRPATILIPLYGADYEAYENYRSFSSQLYPEHQIVFGVANPEDSAVPIIRKLQADYPESDIHLSICGDVHGQNLKVSNLINMMPLAKHEVIFIADSDVRVGPDYLKSLVPILNDEHIGLVTCLYRSGMSSGFANRLEAVGISSDFCAGVLMARMLEGMRFALGATMATTKTALARIGGFESVSDYLADDYRLGNLMWRAGLKVSLSHYVVDTYQD